MEQRSKSSYTSAYGTGHGGGGRGPAVAAPFVVKTYRMVSEPATDSVIAWGRDNNSFLVLDPVAFAETLLPVHFKNNNLLSFIHQLNTYGSDIIHGFRKVNPENWEFAHPYFCRGQTHLLRHIVRRNSTGSEMREEGENEADRARYASVAREIANLIKEQKELAAEVDRMWCRCNSTGSEMREEGENEVDRAGNYAWVAKEIANLQKEQKELAAEVERMCRRCKSNEK